MFVMLVILYSVLREFKIILITLGYVTFRFSDVKMQLADAVDRNVIAPQIRVAY